MNLPGPDGVGGDVQLSVPGLAVVPGEWSIGSAVAHARLAMIRDQFTVGACQQDRAVVSVLFADKWRRSDALSTHDLECSAPRSRLARDARVVDAKVGGADGQWMLSAHFVEHNLAIGEHDGATACTRAHHRHGRRRVPAQSILPQNLLRL